MKQSSTTKTLETMNYDKNYFKIHIIVVERNLKQHFLYLKHQICHLKTQVNIS